MTFELDIPASVDHVVLALHGHADDPRLLADAVRSRRPAPSWHVTAPEGPTVTPSGRAWFPSEHGDDGPPLVDVVEELAGAVLDARRRNLTRTGEIAALGWSQGAATALALALRAAPSPDPWRPRHVVALAAWLPNEPTLEWDLPAAAAAGTTVALVHGRHDEVVPVQLGRGAARALERAGVDVSWIEVDAGHQLEPLLDAGWDWLLAATKAR